MCGQGGGGVNVAGGKKLLVCGVTPPRLRLSSASGPCAVGQDTLVAPPRCDGEAGGLCG